MMAEESISDLAGLKDEGRNADQRIDLLHVLGLGNTEIVLRVNGMW